jgi:hypothetical protein
MCIQVQSVWTDSTAKERLLQMADVAATTPIVKKKVKASAPAAEPIVEQPPVKATTAKAKVKAKPTSKTATPAKKKKEQPVGMNTAQFAEKISELLGRDVTPTALRRVLRTDDGGYNDKEYSRYSLSEADLPRIAELMKSGTTEGTRKRGRKAKSEAQVDEAPDELGDLDENEEILEDITASDADDEEEAEDDDDTEEAEEVTEEVIEEDEDSEDEDSEDDDELEDLEEDDEE